jgi:DNA-binding GntR family transcriptional regulator
MLANRMKRGNCPFPDRLVAGGTRKHQTMAMERRQADAGRPGRAQGPDLPALKHDPLREQVYLQLREALMSGRFKPGEVIPIRSIAEAMGTSAMPVREALRRLVAEQALEVLRNRSVALPPMTRERFDELYRVRVMLEGTAAAGAATRITPGELRTLERLSREIERHIKAGDSSAYLKSNVTFHFAIYHAARSRVLLPLIESLWLQVGPFFNHTAKVGDYRLAHQHHEEALAGLAARDPEAARAGIVGDITSSAEYLLEAYPFDQPDGPADTQAAK